MNRIKNELTVFWIAKIILILLGFYAVHQYIVTHKEIYAVYGCLVTLASIRVAFMIKFRNGVIETLKAGSTMKNLDIFD